MVETSQCHRVGIPDAPRFTKSMVNTTALNQRVEIPTIQMRSRRKSSKLICPKHDIKRLFCAIGVMVAYLPSKQVVRVQISYSTPSKRSTYIGPFNFYMEIVALMADHLRLAKSKNGFRIFNSNF